MNSDYEFKALVCDAGAVFPVQGERFEDWLTRWAAAEGRALFASRAAQAHREREVERLAREKRALVAFERLRRSPAGARARTVLVSGKAPTWRQAGPWLAALDSGRVNSVFGLGEGVADERPH